MKLIVKIYLLLLSCCLSLDSQAVQVSQNGLGEVLIFPYYTVNNDLNTLYTVINTTAQPKAIKIRFLEGQNSYSVLTLNVYLSAYDVWTGALVPTISSVTGHIDEPSASHLTADQSCSPYLTRSGQEFLPGGIDNDTSLNDGMQRVREGHFEVIEMGVITGEAVGYVEHGLAGVPNACNLIEQAWETGEWSLTGLDEPTGGLTGSASLINVLEGIAFSYDALVLQNFWQGPGLHTEPVSDEPDLSAAAPNSLVMNNDGSWIASDWATGFQAVSAVMLQKTIFAEYALDSVVNGHSEWVVTFPTKHYHTNNDQASLPPFESRWNQLVACDEYEMDMWDREEQLAIDWVCSGITCPPRPSGPSVCYAANVFEFFLPGQPATISSSILGSHHHILHTTPSQAVTENGWARIDFNQSHQRLVPISGVGFKGLPSTGFVVQQFTNAGAAQGLLAQYGSLFKQTGIFETF